MAKTYQALIIDDNESLHETIKDILEGDPDDDGSEAGDALFGDSEDSSSQEESAINYQGSSAFQGEEGFELYKKKFDEGNPFDLVICDMRMPPGWNGLKTMAAIGKLNPKAIIFLCTAFTDHPLEEVQKEVKTDIPVDIIPKPFKPKKILEMLEEKINQHIKK